jgi:hypothetical protein
MYREIIEKLGEWKNKEEKKLLFLTGQKGNGKSFIAKDFAEGFFENYVLLDFLENEYASIIFKDGLNRDRIIKFLSITSGKDVKKEDTLIVFENLNTLNEYGNIIKFLSEEMKEYHIIITSDKKIAPSELYEIKYVNPLSFNEFLINLRQSELIEKIKNSSKLPLTEDEMNKSKELLRIYFLIGGMPEIVKVFIETNSLKDAIKKRDEYVKNLKIELKNIDSGAFSNKLIQIMDSLETQLSKENKKFQYGNVKITARRREYSDALDYLVDSYYIQPLYRVVKPVMPLKDKVDDKSFEAYLSDIGIMSGISGIGEEELDINNMFLYKNKMLLHQFIFQELINNRGMDEIYYWVSEATAKIDFVFEDNMVIPVEINLKDNHKAQSLKVLKQRFKNEISICITEDIFKMENSVLKIPIYSLWNL